MAAQGDPSVGGDDERDRYVGTGGLLIRRGGSTSTREQVADCADCVWVLRDYCLLGGDDCRSAFNPCVLGDYPYRVLFGRTRVSVTQVAVTCVGPEGPTTVRDVTSRLSDRFERAVPALRPRAQPDGVALVGVPSIFAVGQPNRMSSVASILGWRVTIAARPQWCWRFDGATRTSCTTNPGGRWPNVGVTHAWSRPGDVTVRVTSTWRGSYTIEGFAPRPLGGQLVRQSETLAIAVREARGVLVSR